MNWDRLNLKVACNEVERLQSEIMRKRVAIKSLGLKPSDWEIVDDALARAYSDLAVSTRALNEKREQMMKDQ